MANKHTNILIIGSGLSGAVAALTAAELNKKVTLITKSQDLLSGNTPWAQGGIAYTSPQDSAQLFMKDIIQAGDHHSNIEAIQQLVDEGPQLIEDLLFKKLNIPFIKDKNGQLIFTSEAAHSTKRIIYCQDKTGITIQQKILNIITDHPNITLYTNHTAID